MRKYYIYKITNLINGKTYIGQRKCPANVEPEEDIKYMGSGKHLKCAEKKYGMENFKKDILVKYIPTKERTDDLEIKYIKYERMWHGKENCYNITDGGEGSHGVHYTVSDETKAKMSCAQKHMSVENRAKINAWKQNMSAETKTKMSAAKKGRYTSTETRAKMSAAAKGKHLSAETREKISYAKQHMSDETKAKISAANKGKPGPMKGKHPSAETRAKMSKAQKGKHPSAETKAKISATIKRNNYRP